MNKHEKEVVKAQLMSEKQTLRTIQAVYKKALQDVENKLVISNGKIETLLKDIDSLTDEQQSILQSQIYQRKMQRSLKSQLEIILKDLAVNQYRTVNDYLKNSYQNGYIGALYNINMQGMPMILPVDPYLVHRAIEIDSKIKHGLYKNLVDKVDVFKRRIANDISRGIASSASYHDIASWIRHDTKVSVGKSMRIVRTEGNRVYNAATLDCGKGAKERGCDLVKVWDSTLDMKTRPTHRECDGQVRELDESFKNANGEAKAPGQFGIASEDINCRCAVLIKPRWDVDSRFTKRDNQSGELKEFEGVKEYEEFKRRYWESVDKSGKSGIIKEIEEVQKISLEKLKYSGMAASDYDNYKKIISEHENHDIRKLYSKYADKIDSVKLGNTGYYEPSKNELVFDYPKYSDMNKYETLAHEYGHFFDKQAEFDSLSFKEIEGVYKITNLNTFKNVASSSDEFLKAVRKDKEYLKQVYLNESKEYKEVINQELKSHNASSGIQDAIDGLFVKSRIRWGHGEKYYNRKYSSVQLMEKLTGSPLKKNLQQFYKDIGLDVSNQTKVKVIVRQYDAASEMWANIMSAVVCGGEALDYVKKYLPNSYKALIKIIGKVI